MISTFAPLGRSAGPTAQPARGTFSGGWGGHDLPLRRIRRSGATTFERNLASALLGLTGANDVLPQEGGVRFGQFGALPDHDARTALEQVDAAEVLHAAGHVSTAGPGRAGDWSAIESLIGSVPGPEDSAREHDHYLYGSPKRAKAE